MKALTAFQGEIVGSGSLGRQRRWLWGSSEKGGKEVSRGKSYSPKKEVGRTEWGHPRMERGWGMEQGWPKSKSASWQRRTQRPFKVSDLGVAHPQLGHCFRQCSLLSWDKKSLLLFQNTPSSPCLPPWASPPSSELAQHSVFPSLPATLATPSP